MTDTLIRPDVFPPATQFESWLAEQSPDRELGIAMGYVRHPIALFLNETWGGRWCVGNHRWGSVIVHDLLGDQPRQKGFVTSWVAPFCRALLPPDSYRTVTAAECLSTLARILNENRDGC